MSESEDIITVRREWCYHQTALQRPGAFDLVKSNKREGAWKAPTALPMGGIPLHNSNRLQFDRKESITPNRAMGLGPFGPGLAALRLLWEGQTSNRKQPGIKPPILSDEGLAPPHEHANYFHRWKIDRDSLEHE